LLNNLKTLALSLDQDSIINHIIPQIKALSIDKTWRVRLATCNFIPVIPDFLDRQLFIENIEPIVLSFFEDSVHHVRMESIKCLIKLKNEQFNQEWMNQMVKRKMEELHNHTRFGFRIHTLFILNELEKEMDDKFLNELFKNYLKQFSEDKVPNIRFNFAKTVGLVYPRLSNSNKMESSGSLKKLSELDTDFDVKFFAAKTLSEIQQSK
jgi:hypothetical protein